MEESFMRFEVTETLCLQSKPQSLNSPGKHFNCKFIFTWEGRRRRQEFHKCNIISLAEVVLIRLPLNNERYGTRLELCAFVLRSSLKTEIGEQTVNIGYSINLNHYIIAGIRTLYYVRIHQPSSVLPSQGLKRAVAGDDGLIVNKGVSPVFCRTEEDPAVVELKDSIHLSKK